MTTNYVPLSSLPPVRQQRVRAFYEAARDLSIGADLHALDIEEHRAYLQEMQVPANITERPTYKAFEHVTCGLSDLVLKQTVEDLVVADEALIEAGKPTEMQYFTYLYFVCHFGVKKGVADDLTSKFRDLMQKGSGIPKARLDNIMRHLRKQ